MTSSPGGGILDYFFDFDADGVFGNNINEVFRAELTGGTETVPVVVPAAASDGVTYARFRLSSAGELGPLSMGPDGEVEDYQVLILAQPSLSCSPVEYFDGVTAPGLPTDWTTTSTGNVLWSTSTAGPDTAPNTAFVADTGVISQNMLSSPVVAISDTTLQFRFRNHYDTEDYFDGGVLEITIGAGARQDILDAGGQFAAGGYNRVLSSSYQNPLGGRQAWSGDSGGFIDTIVDLPPSALGQNVQFHWIEATDVSVAGAGWRVDTIQLCSIGFDFDSGDANDPPYATLNASGGAAHVVGGTLHLGAAIDIDTDGQPTSDATGDDTDAGGDDEDGVTFTSGLELGTMASVDVVASEAGLLNAWIDFNDDGDWLDPGEQIFQDLALAAGTNSLLFAVPADGVVTSQTIARFRLSTQAGLSFTGLAPDGEVEDYAVAISNPAPTDLTVTPSSITENTDTSGGDVEIGTLTPTDVATGDTYTYSLVAGDGDTDNGSFVIVGDKLLVQQGTELDFETQAAYSVRVNVNDGFSDFAKALTVSIDDLPEVEQVSVGDGSEARSMVTQVVVTFDQILVLDAGVFSVQQRGATGGPVDVSYTTSDVGGKTVATLTFSGAFVESSGSLADGNYDLTIDATKARTATDVPLDGDRDGTAGGDYQLGTAAADAFFRLFGDRDGSRSVGLIDYAYLLNTFGKRTGDEAFDPQFDHDISGSVGFLDYAFFLEQYRKRMIFE